MRLGREQQVAALLEGIGLLGAGIDFDHPAPDRRRALREDAAEGEVGVGVRRRVLLRRVVVEVLAGAAGVAAGHPRLGARARQLGVHPHLAVGRAEAERRPVEPTVALHLGALGGEDPGLLGEVLGVDVAQGGGLADGELDHRVEQRVDLVVGRGPVLPDLRLGALLEDDQRAPADRGAALGDRDLDPHRLAQLHPARHVHEHAVAPVGLVAGDERILDRRPATRAPPAAARRASRPPRPARRPSRPRRRSARPPRRRRCRRRGRGSPDR